jgi:hypothetical protein
MFSVARHVVAGATRLVGIRAMSVKATEPWFNFAGKTAVVTGAGKGV